MIIGKSTIAALTVAAGMATALVTGAVTSSVAAARSQRAQSFDSQAYNAWASTLPPSERQAGGWFAHGAPDDPPGSAFQTYGVDQSIGYVR